MPRAWAEEIALGKEDNRHPAIVGSAVVNGWPIKPLQVKETEQRAQPAHSLLRRPPLPIRILREHKRGERRRVEALQQ